MARSHHRDPSITQSNDASHVTPRRGMPRRAKRHSNKVDRQNQQRDTEQRIDDYTDSFYEDCDFGMWPEDS